MTSKNSPCPCGSGKKFKHCCERLQKADTAAAGPDHGSPVANQPSAAEFEPLIKLFNARRYAELEERTKLLLAVYPSAPFAWQLLGGALQMQGKDAVAAFQKVAGLTPGNPEAHFNLGVALGGNGQPEQAAVSYRRALSLKPNYVGALNNLGGVLQDLHQFEEAAARYRQLLVIQPVAADVHNRLGLVLKSLGRHDEAVLCYRQMVALKPGSSEAHNNLGVALNMTSHSDEAMQHFQRAIEITPGFGEAHYNLGNALSQSGRWNQAEKAFRQALQSNLNFAVTYNNLGFALRQQGRLDEAVTCFRKAIELDLNSAEAYGNLGGVLKIQGFFTEALACYRKQAELTPENEGARYHIAALSGENAERAPEQYVSSLFDGYADKFDKSLVQDLKYDIPHKMISLLRRGSILPEDGWAVLDLGCGTGLVGVEIAAITQRMVGVDLSSGMLAKAHERSLYERLECADLLTVMRGEPTASYNLVIAADVFVYIGKLEEIFFEAKRLLAPQGVFAFSVESSTPQDGQTTQETEAEYRLQITGRYSHSTGYLTRLAATNGLQVRELEPTLIRMERGAPVNGLMALLTN
jgi:predicted TPR repeat methyltransferase